MMLKNTLLLFSILVLTGCVERGFELTVNERTNTITAIKSVDIRKADTEDDIDTMNKAVSQAQNEQVANQEAEKAFESAASTKTEHEVSTVNTVHGEAKKETPDPIATKKQEQEQSEAKATAERLQIEKERVALETKLAQEKERVALETKLAQEKEAQKLAAEKQRAHLAKKAEMEKRAQEQKEQALIDLKEEEERKALAEKLAIEKAARAKKQLEEKLALERKIAKEKVLQQQKEQKARNALAQKIAKDKQRAIDQQKEQETAQAQKLAALKTAEALRKKANERKQRLKESIEKQQTKKRHTIQTSEGLNFRPSSQTYQKFGTSEIHGHVVYLTPTGQEISLQNTKIYLVPQNTTTDYWYNNYYLKNKKSTATAKNTVHYINATHLNLEKNFAFYGLATGIYYVIIESSYPSNIAKNKKVYIAKKISVEKYKKIMTVFSKRL